MMRVVSGVVAHIDRKQMALQLAEQIGAAYISMDDGELGAGRNHLRVWTHLAHEDADWLLVCEDDCVPVAQFQQQLHACLEHSPCPITSLYLGTGRPPQHQHRIKDAVEKADANNAAYITAPYLFHAVAVAVKTELVPQMVMHLQRKQYLPTDEGISQWARTQRHLIAYSCPSLVQHRDCPTLVKHRDGQPRTQLRKAWTIGTRDTWDSGSVTI